MPPPPGGGTYNADLNPAFVPRLAVPSERSPVVLPVVRVVAAVGWFDDVGGPFGGVDVKIVGVVCDKGVVGCSVTVTAVAVVFDVDAVPSGVVGGVGCVFGDCGDCGDCRGGGGCGLQVSCSVAAAGAVVIINVWAVCLVLPPFLPAACGILSPDVIAVI